jgi:hypothetical protein
MDKVEASRAAVVAPQALRLAFNERRRRPAPLLGHEAGRLCMAAGRHGPWAEGPRLAWAMARVVEHARASVRPRHVGPGPAAPGGGRAVGKSRAPLGRTSPAGHAVKTSAVELGAVGLGGELGVNQECMGDLSSPRLPIGDAPEPLVMGCRFLPRPVGGAQDPRGGIGRQANPQALWTTAARGPGRLVDEGLLAVARPGMEGEREGEPRRPAPWARGLVPQAPEPRSTGRGDTATRRG